jgi:hypothetical protein
MLGMSPARYLPRQYSVVSRKFVWIARTVIFGQLKDSGLGLRTRLPSVAGPLSSCWFVSWLDALLPAYLLRIRSDYLYQSSSLDSEESEKCQSGFMSERKKGELTYCAQARRENNRCRGCEHRWRTRRCWGKQTVMLDFDDCCLISSSIFRVL